MAQFDVYRNRDPATQAIFPYLLDLQHDLLSALASRVVAPLMRSSELSRPMSFLNPTFEIEGVEVVMSTQELAGVARTVLGEHVLCLESRRDELIGALDMLFTGI